MLLHSVDDTRFLKYGRVLRCEGITECLKRLSSLKVPAQGVIYVPSEASFEAAPLCEHLERAAFGAINIQFGYCIGHKYQLNALEYHRTSEINLMATDVVLLLGTREKLSDDFCYCTDDIEGFYVPAGTLLEIYSNTLHYSPLSVNENGFCIAVILPRGTNTPLPTLAEEGGEAALLTEKNKWLIAHPEAEFPFSAYRGLIGRNLSINDIENLDNFADYNF